MRTEDMLSLAAQEVRIKTERKFTASSSRVHGSQRHGPHSDADLAILLQPLSALTFDASKNS